MKYRLVFLIAVFYLAGCAQKSPVPEVDDVKNIVVDGQHYTAEDFALKFCPGYDAEPTCLKVKRAAAMERDSGGGSPARF